MSGAAMYTEVLEFWFQALSPAQWWAPDVALDATISRRFGALHQRAVQAELHAWRSEPAGRLAEILVLDQFSRNIHRGSAAAFAADAMALALAQKALGQGADQSLAAEQRLFLYMPYMHSESRHIHRIAEVLFREHAAPSNYDFELRHKAIIDRFGRYPHRNAILGRASSAQELAFLQQPGSAF